MDAKFLAVCLIAFLFSALSFAEKGTCIVNPCVKCGERRQFFGRKSDYHYIESTQVILRQNSGDCHIWEEKEKIFGCVDHGECKPKGGNRAILDCLKRNALRGSCEKLIRKELSEQGCHVTKMECHDDVLCEIESTDCFHPWVEESVIAGDKYECPAGSELKNIVGYGLCRWKRNSLSSTSVGKAASGLVEKAKVDSEAPNLKSTAPPNQSVPANSGGKPSSAAPAQ